MTAPAFKLAPGLSREAAAEDIVRLAPLRSMFRATERRYPELFTWQYVSLESGVHLVFPGHGGFPPDFEPRRRSSYNRARKEGEPVAVMNIDAVTGDLLFTVSMPVYDTQGRFAGVTGVDAPLYGLFLNEVAAYPWSRHLRSFIVQASPRETGEGKALSVFADLSPTFRPTEEEPELHWLLSKEEDYDKMVAEIESEGSGVRQMDFEGEPHFWAYKAMGRKGAAMVLLLPAKALSAAAEATERDILQYNKQLTLITGLIMLIVAAVSVLGALFVSRSITRPLASLAQAAKRLANGDFQARTNIRRRDELGEVGRTFDSMVPRLLEGIRMRESLEVASSIQQHLLPESPPRLPGLDIEGICVYSGLTGGDYFDYLHPMGRDGLAIAVGDVTGHGVPSALLMTGARTLLRTRAAAPGDLAEVLTDVNRALTRDIARANMFMTLFLLQIAPDRRSVRWATAGHEPAILYDRDKDSFTRLTAEGMPLGVQEDSTYEEGFTKVKPGQVIVLGTDGVWETRNAKRELFGEARLHEVIRNYATAPAQGIVTAVLEALTRFRGGLPQADDTTLVVVKIVG